MISERAYGLLVQQRPVINCRFRLAKIVRIRGLCDYPSMALNDGEMGTPRIKPLLIVKLQQHFTFIGIKTNIKAKSEY